MTGRYIIHQMYDIVDGISSMRVRKFVWLNRIVIKECNIIYHLDSINLQRNIGYERLRRNVSYVTLATLNNTFHPSPYSVEARCGIGHKLSPHISHPDFCLCNTARTSDIFCMIWSLHLDIMAYSLLVLRLSRSRLNTNEADWIASVICKFLYWVMSSVL